MTRYCSACGAALADDDRFCMGCGAKVVADDAATSPEPVPPPPPDPPSPRPSEPETAIAPMPTAPPPPPRGRRVPWSGIGLAVVALAALGGGAAWYLAHRADGESADTTGGGSASTTPPAATTGTWHFSATEDGITALFRREGASAEAPAPFRLDCNGDDGVISFLAMVPEGASDRVASSADRKIRLRGDGRATDLVGHLVSAPGETAIGFEIDNTSASHATIGAADFAVATPIGSVAAGTGAERAGLVAFLAACPAPPVAPSDAAPRWRTLTRATQGVRLAIPAGLFRLVAADRTGRAWEALDGRAAMTFSARPNATEAGFPDAAREDLPALDTVTYRTQGRDWVAVSGVVGTRVVHAMGRRTCGGSDVATFTVTYEPADDATYAPLVRRMAESFLVDRMPDGRSLCP
jgi:hypothetical protein